MGTIFSGIGLISGIDTATLIEQLIAIESRGKVALQRRIGTLQAQRTAMLDINSRLLNLKSASGAFRADKIFSAANAASSNESILSASASPGAVPGLYTFIVDRLVSASQVMTRGFSDTDESAIGLARMTFELGGGRLSRESELSELNGGAGVRRGKIIITDRAGPAATVDLSRAGEISEVIDAINSASTISVSARISGDRIVIEDTSGGSGTLSVQNAAGYFTASDLGIAGTGSGMGIITGSQINTLGDTTALSRLNDGNGVVINSGLGNTDFTITDRAGATHNIILGQFLNNGITEPAVTTIAGVIERINTITGGAVTASISSDGVSLTLTDATGGAGTLTVAGAGTNGDRTALDLGILGAGAGDTLDGERILAGMNSVLVRSLHGGDGLIFGSGVLTGQTRLADLFNGAGLQTNGTSDTDMRLQDREGTEYFIDFDALTTVQDLIDAVDTETSGNITFSINGNALRATNESIGLQNFQIGDVNDSTAVAQLGLTADNNILDGNVVDGVDTNPAAGGTNLVITNRNGVQTNINLSSAESMGDIIALINNAGAGVRAEFNDAGNGLRIIDETGGSANLIIAGGGAASLRIATLPAGVAADSVTGGNLQHQYVAGGTRLDSLNYGGGIGTGTFRIVDATGDSAIVDIGTDSKTLQDIINEINSKGLEILARVNDNGDGLLIESTSVSGTLAIRVENLTGSTARDLGIAGEASDPLNANFIDGSYERAVTFEPGATLADIVAAVNDADIPLVASIVNTGAGSSPFRITFASEVTGAEGELSIDSDGFDMGLSVLSRGQDARVFFGSNDPAKAVLLKSETNTLDNVVKNLRIDLIGTSDQPVTVTVKRDIEAIVEAARRMVTTFNDAIGRIDQYDKYDAETEERGLLLGDPTVARVRSALYRTAQGRAIGVSGQFQYLSQIGIRVGAEGVLELDEPAFRAALETDFEDVEELLTAFEKETTNREIAPGIETGETIETFTKLGLAEQFNRLVDQLTGANGAMTRADDNFEAQIEGLQDRIEIFDQRLEARRAQLQREFQAMEAALARLQTQQAALASLSSAVLTASIGGIRSFGT